MNTQTKPGTAKPRETDRSFTRASGNAPKALSRIGDRNGLRCQKFVDGKWQDITEHEWNQLLQEMPQ